MKSFDSKLKAATSRRALFAPGLLSLLAPALVAKAARPSVTLTVGGLFSLTGNSSDFGTQSSLMMKIAASDLGPLLFDYNASPPAKDRGVAFELLIEDTQLDPQKAAMAAQSLIERGAQFLIGPQTSSEVTRVKTITDQAGVVLISPGSTASTLSLPGDTVFRFVPDDTLESKAVAQVAAGDGIQAIVPVWRGDDGNRGLAASLKQFGPGFGIAVAAGFEYAVAGTDFDAVATSLAGAVATLKATIALSKIAVFMAAFDDGAALLNAATKFPDLGAIKWYAGDGVTLSNAYLAPGPAQFAAATRLLAPSLGLPAEAKPLIDPVLVRTAAAGVPSPVPFAFAAYDGFICATLAWLLASGNRRKVRDILPEVAKMHFGTTGWALLNSAGDRATGTFEFFGVVNGQWKGLLTAQVSN